VSEEELDQVAPAEDLLKMEGINKGLAYQLASKGVITMEDLAELSVDELSEITGLDSVIGGELIMTARAPWFEGEQPSE
jgi:N utilization substance protein A